MRFCRAVVATIIGTAVAGGLGCAAVTTPGARPNSLFMMTDDQVSRGVGAYGNGEVITPNLDRLRREGAMLRNAFVPTPACSARCRNAFVRGSGRYATALGATRD